MSGRTVKDVTDELARWIHQTADADVYTRTANKVAPRYIKKGGNKGPTAFVRSKNGTYGLVIKDGESSDNVHNAARMVVQYWQAYTSEEMRYFDDGITSEEIDQSERNGSVEDNHKDPADHRFDVDAFLIATQYSQNGHVFKPEREKFLNRSRSSSGVKVSGEPTVEGSRSSTLFRTLYRIMDVYEDSISPGVGLLVSSDLKKLSVEEDTVTTTDSDPMVHYYEADKKIVFDYL